MMIGHCDRGAVLQFRMGNREVVQTDRGLIQMTTRSTTITFKNMTPGIPTRRIKTRYGSNGRLLSFIDTEQEAKRLKVPEDELIAWLKDHPSWNERMIAVNDETTDAVGDEGYGDAITPTGTGGFHCTACDKFIRDGRGVPNHIKSHAHQDAIAALRGEARQSA